MHHWDLVHRSSSWRRLALGMMVLLIGGSGCSRTPGWFRGVFELDAEKTMEAMVGGASDHKAVRHEEGLLGALGGLAKAFAPLALSQRYGGAILTISEDEIITVKNGSGTVMRYEVHDRPNANTLVIKTSEARVETWFRTESGIATMAEGDLAVEIHFRRKE